MGYNNQLALEKIRAEGLVPCSIQGDRLPNKSLQVGRKQLMPFLRRVHFQRELFTLQIDDGETVQVIASEVAVDSQLTFNVQHELVLWKQFCKTNFSTPRILLIFR